MSLKVLTERDGYHSPFESLSWRPIDVNVGLARVDGELICATPGTIDWEALSGEERIALGYLLSKALGHPKRALDRY